MGEAETMAGLFSKDTGRGREEGGRVEKEKGREREKGRRGVWEAGEREGRKEERESWLPLKLGSRDEKKVKGWV